MIAVDTSSMIYFLEGGKGRDIDLLNEALLQNQVVLPPVVSTEILCDPKLSKEVKEVIYQLPLLEITSGYWYRAATLREKLLKKKLKAPLVDTLISQSCIDHKISLITRDSDFRHFVPFGLVLL